MSELKRVEMAAMWFYHNQYAAQNLGAIDFYKNLPLDKKQLMEEMVDDILRATP